EAPSVLHYVDVDQSDRTIEVPARGFGFTFCQVPITIATHPGAADALATVRWFWRDGRPGEGRGHLDRAASEALLTRTGHLDRIAVEVSLARLFCGRETG
ncbi:MAG TPA: hypothetical protein PK095_08050, partial [Myxococcota bacterium]|nr:hypothetical protein [Myxococcota bacterium]